MNTLTANSNTPIVDFSTIVLADIVPTAEKKSRTLTPIVGDFEINWGNPNDNNWVVVDTRVVTIEEFNSGL